MSKSSRSGSKAYPKECPSIINASDDSKDPSSASNWCSCIAVSFSCKFNLVSFFVCSLMINKFISSLSNLHDIPILMAVSCLSPVKTQILIPACCKVWIVSETPSCNLSSIAVAPSKNKSFSINSAAASNLSLRLSNEVDAS